METLFELKNSPDLGRYLVAKKDFKCGASVFVESPIVVYSGTSVFKRLLPKQSTCLGCFGIIRTKLFHCKRCKWPACSRLCLNDATHKKLECRLFKSAGILWTPDVVKCLRIVRSVLMKKKDPEGWSQLLSLTSKCAKEDSDVLFDDNNTEMEVMQKYLEESLNLRVSLPLLKRLSSILTINSFGHSDVALRIQYGMLFATTSLFAHSCSPNLEWTISNSYEECDGNWSISLRSRRDINIGEMLTIAYTGDRLDCGTVERRYSIVKSFEFFCCCDRCKSPSELGSYYSGVKCCKCEQGWVLPHCKWNVKSFSMTTQHICDKCNHSHSDADILDTELSFEDRLKHILKKHKPFSGSSRVKKLDVLITEATEKYQLHPNHELVINAILQWVTALELKKVLLGSSQKTKILFEKVMERADRGQFVYKLIADDTHYALMEACLATSMCIFHFKSNDCVTIRKDVYGRQEKCQLISKILQHMSNAMQFLEGRNYDSDDVRIVQSLKRRFGVWKKHLSHCDDSGSSQSVPKAVLNYQPKDIPTVITIEESSFHIEDETKSRA